MKDEKYALVTGCLGNLGMYVTMRLIHEKYRVIGIDNNFRKYLLGPEGDTGPNMRMLMEAIDRGDLMVHNFNIAEAEWDKLFPDGFDAIVHTAAQVSHPRSIDIPADDFNINALGTFRLLEYLRNTSPQADFIHIGTAKIYGKSVDRFPVFEDATRFWYDLDLLPSDFNGVSETNVTIDQTMKTPFGCSKAYADLIVQEYGMLYGLKTVVLRPSCFAGKYTRPTLHQRWEAYIMKKILAGETVQVFGYDGKQVRDILHCHDLTDAIVMMLNRMPHRRGDVFNIGGGMANAISVKELIYRVAKHVKIIPKTEYLSERAGDWRIFVTDNRKLQGEYPDWRPRRDLDIIIGELYEPLNEIIAAERGHTQSTP